MGKQSPTQREGRQRDILNRISYHILESMEDWVRVIDVDGHTVYMNRAMKQSYEEDKLGFLCDYVEGAKDPTACIEIMHSLGDSPVVEQKEISGKTYSIKSSPVFDEKGRIIAFVEVFRDITAQTKARVKLLEANRKMVDDLVFARNIQRLILPSPGAYGEISFDYRYISSEQLSGDIFDIIRIGPDMIGVYIADIAGHGITASILTMFVRQTMRFLVKDRMIISPGKVLEELRDRYAELGLEDDKYFTIFYGVYNEKNHRFTYANGGHNCIPIMFNRSGHVMMKNSGLPISSLFIGQDYKERSMELVRGDKLLFYTDGIIETRNINQEQFGEDRLLKVIDHSKGSVLDDIVRAVHIYRWGEIQDDIALLLMEVNWK